MTRFVLIAILLPAAARAAAPTRASSELLVRDLKRQLNETTRRLEEKREGLARATAALGSVAAAFATYAGGPPVAPFATRSAPQAPGSPAEKKAGDAALSAWIEQREALAALGLKAALLAEELQRYKETGLLSPTLPAVAERFKLLIETPWSLPASARDLPTLSLDLVKLQKQLREYADIFRRLPDRKRLKPSRPAAQNLPAPGKQPVPSSIRIDGDRPRFERDAGRGAPANDPIPGLILLLSSSDPRGRALAADELGNFGAPAARVVLALRQALADPDRRVRASAAMALGAVASEDSGVITDLRRAMHDPDEDVRFNAETALKKLERP